MKIHITEPHGLCDTVLQQKLRARWQARGASFYQATDYETHGELLERLWLDIVDPDDPVPHHVISELDFVPYGGFVAEMAWLLDQAPLVFVPYVTRRPEGELVDYNRTPGAWLIGVNKSLCRTDNLSTRWLRAGGPRNDAANDAFNIAVADSAVLEDEPIWLYHRDEWPEFAGLEYEGLGFHSFFHRHFDDDPALQLFPGYTLGHHLNQLAQRLGALETK